MSRSAAVRSEALRLDGKRCQITGAAAKDGKPLEVHHWKKLGMGGSDEKDNVENCITLDAHIHALVEGGALVIAFWDRGGREVIVDDGDVQSVDVTDPILEVIDNQNCLGHGIGRVDHSLLWFYRRHHVEELEQAEIRVQARSMIDRQIAADLWTLKQDKAFKELEPTASSFSQYAASRGLDARRASMLADLYGEAGAEWPEDVSAADFRRTLKDATTGDKLRQSYIFGTIVGETASGIGGPVQYIVEFKHSRDEDGLREGLSDTEGMFRVGKWCKRGPYMREADDGQS